MKILINLQTGLVSNSGMQADKAAFNNTKYGSNTESPDFDELEEHEEKMAEQAEKDLRKKLASELREKDDEDKKKSSGTDSEDEDEDDSGFGDLDDEDEDLDLGLDDEDEEV